MWHHQQLEAHVIDSWYLASIMQKDVDEALDVDEKSKQSSIEHLLELSGFIQSHPTTETLLFVANHRLSKKTTRYASWV